MSSRSELTPHMLDYEEKFSDSGEIRWLPHLIYFHPANHRSPVVNTDSRGFRYSERNGTRYSVADREGIESVRLLAGSSTVFGIGASSDRWTLSSRLSENDVRGEPWVNFGGRSFNSTQELLLITLYRHLLPKVEEIVLFSGFNDLGLARLPVSRHLDEGAFFLCNQFFDAFKGNGSSGAKSVVKRMLRGRQEAPGEVPTLDEQMRFAAGLTVRHLDVWRALANDFGARLTYILQPLSGWVRPRGTEEEEALFAELDQLGRFSDTYGDILQPEVCLEYASLLQSSAAKIGVNFVNMATVLADVVKPDQWIFVDRIHFTDQGSDFVAKQILEVTR
jgi:hypothetical protein